MKADVLLPTAALQTLKAILGYGSLLDYGRPTRSCNKLPWIIRGYPSSPLQCAVDSQTLQLGYESPRAFPLPSEWNHPE